MKKIVLLLTAVFLLLACTGLSADKYGFPEKTIPGEIIETELGSYYLPSNYSPEKKYPLIVLLHGLGTSSSFFLTMYGWISQAEKREYILCSPKSMQFYWDDSPESPDIQNIYRFISLLSRRYSVRKDKICLFGWSNGGHFTNIMMVHNRPKGGFRPRINAFIEGSGGSSNIMEKYMKKGYLPKKLKAFVFFFWGEMEVPHPGENVYEFLKDQGWDVTAEPHPGTHEIPEGHIDKAFDWLDERIP